MGLDPATLSLLISLGSAGLGAGAGFLKRDRGRSKGQKKQAKLVDQLIASLSGDGPFSDLFSTDLGNFQKSIVDPANQIFQDQIAPGIQQKFIASGQQRGTGLEDSLTRSGVDLQSNINQLLLPFIQGQQKNKLGALGNALGFNFGGQQPSGTESALAGGLSTLQDGDNLENILNFFKAPTNRRGFSG